MATWNTDNPKTSNQILEDVADIEENLQELHDVITAITDGTLGTTEPANFKVDTVAADTIAEKTATTGVTVDGVLLKDNTVTATTLTANTSVVTDTISEKTGAAGVTIDGLLIKDSKVAQANCIDSDQYIDGSIDTAHFAAGAVDAAAMGANSVDSSELVNGSIDTSHFATGAVDQAAIGAAAVGQGELITTTSLAQTTNTSWTTVTVTSLGTYGFYPQFNVSANSGDIRHPQGITNTTYATYIDLQHSTGGGAVVRANFRYITASGPLYWYYVLRRKQDKFITTMAAAPDHPCCGNGGNPDEIPHPFTRCFDDSTGEMITRSPIDNSEIREPGYEIVVVILDEQEQKKLGVEREKKGYQNVAELIYEEYEIDDKSKPKWPSDVDVSVGIGKKKKIPKPKYIKHKKLRKV